MKNNIVILFCLLSFSLLGQRRGLQHIVEDLNQDNFKDTVTTYYEGGSGFGGKFIEIVNGKTQGKFELNTDGCFCEFYRFVDIPDILLETQNEYFLKAIQKHLLPKKREAIDPSLYWLMENYKNSFSLKDNIYFTLQSNPKINWSSKLFEFPSTYFTIVEKKDFDHINFEEKTKKAFLVYYGHNHKSNFTKDSTTLIFKNKTYQIYTTAHGVFVKKGKQYKWLFISDVNVTGAPEKLRWASIETIKHWKHYIFIDQTLAPSGEHQIIFINIKTGNLAILNLDIHDKDIEGKKDYFHISKNKLIISTNETQKTIAIKKLKKELNQINLN